jgi:hypothetical protein
VAHPDYEEFLAACNDHRVRYLIGGAHAVGFYARPRATKDLDIFLDPTPANARRAIAAVRDFFGGTAPRGCSRPSDLLEPDIFVQLGVAPVRIDLLTSFGDGTRFAQAWRRRVDARYGKVDAHYLSLDDLIAQKGFFRRDQDLVDLKFLERARRRR